MKNTVLTGILVLVCGFFTLPEANSDASSLQSLTNRAGAIENQIESLGRRVDGILMKQPGDPNPNGVVNYLEAIDRQLDSASEGCYWLFVEYFEPPADDFEPNDSFESALGNVGAVAYGIVNSTGSFLASPPVDIHPSILIAIENVQRSAQRISNNIDYYLSFCDRGLCQITECLDEFNCIDSWLCLNGRCVPPYSCEDESDCPAGQTCFAAACFFIPSPECVLDDDCPFGQKCNSGICEAIDNFCISDRDCSESTICINNRCTFN